MIGNLHQDRKALLIQATLSVQTVKDHKKIGLGLKDHCRSTKKGGKKGVGSKTGEKDRQPLLERPQKTQAQRKKFLAVEYLGQ